MTDVTALQALPDGGSALGRARHAGQLALADKAWLQSMLESAMQQAADKVLEAQVSLCSPLCINNPEQKGSAAVDFVCILTAHELACRSWSSCIWLTVSMQGHATSTTSITK